MAKANPAIETSASLEAPASVTLDGVALGPPRTLWGDAWRRFRKHRLAMAGAVVLLLSLIHI